MTDIYTTLLCDYLNETTKAREIYGDKAIVLFQNGSFFEVDDITIDSIQIKACMNILELKQYEKSL